jgi:LPXTG-site transpeptidase (sortase) family protein
MPVSKALRVVPVCIGARAFRVLFVLTLLAVAGWPAVAPPAVAAKVPAAYFVPSTGHVLGEPFLSRWAERNGLTTLGLPVSEPVTVDGLATQYFEYGYLQAKSAADHSSRLVQRKAGAELLLAMHDPARTVAGRRVGGSRADTAFHRPAGAADFSVTGRIAAYYQANGGSDRFGKPLSESFVANGMRVQWFEFGRLQWSLAEGEVVAAPVGFELARARGVDTLPVDRGKLPLFEARRFRTYHGDGTIPEAPGPFTPVRIKIPKIKIDADIEKVGIIDGVMDVPKNVWNVGWYPAIAKPGERTNVVMAGHKDWWGVGPVVFWNLDKLAPGDKIYLIAKNGQGFTYVVSKAWQVDANADAGVVIGDTGEETLTLITCGGAFNGAEYLSRQIIRAERI